MQAGHPQQAQAAAPAQDAGPPLPPIDPFSHLSPYHQTHPIPPQHQAIDWAAREAAAAAFPVQRKDRPSTGGVPGFTDDEEEDGGNDHDYQTAEDNSQQEQP